jgi:hypothetical protein
LILNWKLMSYPKVPDPTNYHGSYRKNTVLSHQWNYPFNEQVLSLRPAVMDLVIGSTLNFTSINPTTLLIVLILQSFLEML